MKSFETIDFTGKFDIVIVLNDINGIDRITCEGEDLSISESELIYYKKEVKDYLS